MVGERVWFLFTRALLQAKEWACDNSRVNKNRIRDATMMLFVYYIAKYWDFIHDDKVFKVSQSF
jgi:hypothetical protein